MVSIIIALVVAGLITFNFALIRSASQLLPLRIGEKPCENLIGFLFGVLPNLIGYALVILHCKGII